MKAFEVEGKTEASSVEENKVQNKTLTTELHFELLKQYAWLSSAVIGAIIFLIQLNAIEIARDIYISLGLLGLSIFISLIGQDYIVDSLLKGKDIYEMSKIMRLIRWASTGCLGLGAGFFASNVF